MDAKTHKQQWHVRQGIMLQVEGGEDSGNNAVNASQPTMVAIFFGDTPLTQAFKSNFFRSTSNVPVQLVAVNLWPL